MANLKLVSPWIDFYKKVEAMFADDGSVHVIFDEDAMTLKLYVDGDMKAKALSILMGQQRIFGNITLNIEIIPANKPNRYNRLGGDGIKRTFNMDDDINVYYERLFREAFTNNPVLSFTRVISGFMGFNATYIVFRKTVVQYHNDDISDINGNKSTLLECIARDIFDVPAGIFFCTDVFDNNNRNCERF